VDHEDAAKKSIAQCPSWRRRCRPSRRRRFLCMRRMRRRSERKKNEHEVAVCELLALAQLTDDEDDGMALD